MPDRAVSRERRHLRARAPLWPERRRGVLPAGKAPLAALSAELAEAEPPVLDRVHRARYAEGSALLLRGADGSAVGDMDADVLARAASLSRVVDHRGRCARPAQLSVRGARLRGDDAHLARGHRDLPDALPPPCPSSGAIMQSCKNIRPWQPPADVLYCGRLIFR